MDPIVLDAPAPAERRLEYAGFWIRVVATVIDWIVLAVINWMISFAFFSAYSSDLVNGFSFANIFSVFYLMRLGIAAAYFSLLESSGRQATLGKIAVGVRVGDERGNRISLMNAIGRYFSKILSGLIVCIGYIMVAFDLKKRGLHDMIANTVVYYG